jgi:hypothetical protein
MKKIIPILMLMAAIDVEALCASTTLAYGQRVARAAEQIDRIKTDEQYGEEGVSYIKELLPRSEEVETGSGTIKVDNAWLHRVLDEYRSQEDPQKRLAKLNEAAGRLRALSEHLESAGPEQEAAQSRDRIKEILQRAEYREKTEDRLTALIKRIRNEILEFIRDLFARIFAAIYGAGSGASWFFRGMILLGLGAAIALAVRMAMRIERKKKRSRKRTVLGEEIEEGMTAKELADSALAAARAGDFRMAVRRLYISIIYEMAEQNLLELEPNATNREYLERISRFGALSSLMRQLTERLEYFWYGMFTPTEEDFSAYLETYETGIENVRNQMPEAGTSETRGV